MKAYTTGNIKAYDKGFNAGISLAIKNMTSAMVLVLADEFGMSEDQLIIAIERFNEVFDSINEKRITIFDIVETLRDEHGIQVEVER